MYKDRVEKRFVNSKVNTVTCAVVITANIPHPSNKKTWFGYCRNDGFVKKKNKGRIDANHVWKNIKEQWVSAYLNREVIPEFSIMQKVTAEMEWCAEAYLNTNYDKLTIEDYIETVKEFFLFKLKKSENFKGMEEEDDENM